MHADDPLAARIGTPSQDFDSVPLLIAPSGVRSRRQSRAGAAAACG